MPSPADHVIQVQVIFENDSGIPRDRTINTFHYVTSTPGSAPSSTELDEIQAKLTSAYGTAQTGSTNSLASLMSAALSGVYSMKFYDLHDPAPRVPIRDTGPLTALTVGTTALPAEVAICLSYQDLPASGVNQASRRGRLYIGPLASNSVIVSTTGKPSTSANAIVDTVAAVGAFLKLGTASDCVMVVYSPKLLQWFDFNNGWCDDEFDTQRRRGYRPTTRQTF
jgi:hypothetical protein